MTDLSRAQVAAIKEYATDVVGQFMWMPARTAAQDQLIRTDVPALCAALEEAMEASGVIYAMHHTFDDSPKCQCVHCERWRKWNKE